MAEVALKITDYGDGAVYAEAADKRNCSGELVIPANVTHIAENGFSGTGITSLSFESGSQLMGIGNWAFSGCSSLSGALVIPYGVTQIGWAAFASCSNLTSLTLPSSLEIIDGYAFWGCSSLSGALVIPDGVTFIGDRTFEGCSNLTSLTLPSSLETIGENAFSGISSSATINYLITNEYLQRLPVSCV